MNLQDLGSSPINPENPAGEDIRYLPVFEELQAEVDKLSSPSAAAESIDWQKISTLAAEILRGQSKDLLVASYFSVAQVHLSHIQGLELGLQVYIDLLKNFWDTLFPQMRRMRGRIAAIEWWIEKCESAIRQRAPDILDETVKERIRGQCQQMSQILQQCLPDTPLALQSIIRVIEEIPSGLSPASSLPADNTEPEVKETPEPKASPPPEQQSRPAPLPVSSPPLRSEADTTGSLDSLLKNLNHTAAALLEQDISDPLSYRLLRFSVWSTIEDLPPVTEGKTLVPPPDPQMAAILRDLFNRGDWTSVVTAAEYQLPQYIFWLDLNRFSTIALEHLGPPYQRASECLARETSSFVARFPGLIALKFSDGTPFADKETADWLQSLSSGGTESALDQIPMAGGDASDPSAVRLSEVTQQALVLIKANNLLDAVTLFQKEMRLAFSAKDKMLWRLALCRIFIHSRNADLAVPHFDRVLEDIQIHRLEEWDPAIALQGLKAVWTGFQKVSDKTVRERAALVLHQIARIDPVEAVRIGK